MTQASCTELTLRETKKWTVRFHFCAEYQFNFLALLIGHHYWSVQWPPGFTGFGSSIRRKLGVSLPVLLVSILISICLSMLLKTFQIPSFIHNSIWSLFKKKQINGLKIIGPKFNFFLFSSWKIKNTISINFMIFYQLTSFFISSLAIYNT